MTQAYRPLHAVLAVFVRNEPAGGQDGVDVAQATLRPGGVAPELRWNSRYQGAAEAFGSVTGAAPVFPQDVRRAHQPVVVRGVKRHRRAAHFEQTEPANQRHVVKMYDIERLRENGLESASFRSRPPGLLGDQGRQEAPATAQDVPGDPRRVRRRFYRLPSILKRLPHHLGHPFFFMAVNLAMRSAARRAETPLAPGGDEEGRRAPIAQAR